MYRKQNIHTHSNGTTAPSRKSFPADCIGHNILHRYNIMYPLVRMFCVKYMIKLWGLPLLLPIRVEQRAGNAKRSIEATRVENAKTRM